MTKRDKIIIFNIVLILSLNFLIIIIAFIKGNILKKRLMVLLLLDSVLKADTVTVDENLWSWGVTFPWEFVYVKQSNGERAYSIPLYGAGTYVDYDNIELQVDWRVADFHSNSLENYDNYKGYTYGASLLYGINRRIQMGAYVNKLTFLSMTKSADYEKGTLTGYGLKMIYNPNKIREYNEKRRSQLNYTFSLGYLDGSNVTTYESRYSYINGHMRNIKHKEHPDLSGYSISLGVMSKF